MEFRNLSGKKDDKDLDKSESYLKKGRMPLSMVSGIVICCILIVIGLISNYLGILG